MLIRVMFVCAFCALVVGCGGSEPNPQESKKLTPQTILSEYAKNGKKVVEHKFDEVKPGVYMGYVVLEGNEKTYLCLMNEDSGLGVSTSRMSWTDGPKTLDQVVAERDARKQMMTEKMSMRRQQKSND